LKLLKPFKLQWVTIVEKSGALDWFSNIHSKCLGWWSMEILSFKGTICIFSAL